MPVVGATIEDFFQLAQRLGDTFRPLAAVVMSTGDAWLIGIVMMCQFDSPFLGVMRGATPRRRAMQRRGRSQGERRQRLRAGSEIVGGALTDGR